MGCIILVPNSDLDAEPMLRKFSILIFACLAVATPQLLADQVMSQTICDASSVAKAHIAKRFPKFETYGLVETISDGGDHWEIAYQPPKDSIGGGPIVKIDKRTCSVVDFIITQ